MHVKQVSLSVSLVLLIVPWMAGCIYSKQTGSGWVVPSFHHLSDAPCLLGPIPDGGGADGIIAGSGEVMRSKIRTELLKHGLAVRSGTSSEVQSLLEEGRKTDAVYVVVGRILIWEDNATEWSGKHDHAGVSLEMYEVSSSKLVASAERTADGIEAPIECAPWLAENVVRALLGESTDMTAKPSEIPIAKLADLKEGAVKRVDGEDYRELVLDWEERVFPGEAVEVLGPGCGHEIEYEYDHKTWFDLDNHPRELQYTLFFEDHPPVVGRKALRDLNVF